MSASSTQRKRTRNQFAENGSGDEGKRQRTAATDDPQEPPSDSRVYSPSRLTEMPLDGFEGFRFAEKLTDALHEDKLGFIVSLHFSKEDVTPDTDTNNQSEPTDEPPEPRVLSNRDDQKFKDNLTKYYTAALRWHKLNKQEIQLKNIMGVNEIARRATINAQPESEARKLLLEVLDEKRQQKLITSGISTKAKYASDLIILESVPHFMSKTIQAMEENFAHNCVCAYGELAAVEGKVHQGRAKMQEDLKREASDGEGVEGLGKESRLSRDRIGSSFRTIRNRNKDNFRGFQQRWKIVFEELRQQFIGEGVEMPGIPAQLKELMDRNVDKDYPWHVAKQQRQ